MENELRKLQLTQLEILRVIDEICRRHEIPYSLYAGTLLGAVRHQGFIPWDDDLDICMARKEYDRFLEIWEKEKPEGYLLQNKENAPEFTQSFSKIRKDHTTFRMGIDVGRDYHCGIFVDIFPIDRFPEKSLDQLRFRWDCMRYQLYTREFVPPKGNPVVKLISGLILGMTPQNRYGAIRKKLLKRITRWSEDSRLPAIAIETVGTLRTQYPAQMLSEYVRLPFEDGEFMCFADWDGHLKRKFGDYMQLPPEEDREWKHHPLCIDFAHNFGETEQ